MTPTFLQIPFRGIDVPFTDFLLLVLILLMFYLLMALETLSARKAKTDRSEFLLMNAITLMGIVVTILVGIMAQLNIPGIPDLLYLIAPVGFLSVSVLMYRRTSSILDTRLVRPYAKEVIKQELKEYSLRHHKFTLDQLRRDYATIVTIDWIMQRLKLLTGDVNFAVKNFGELLQTFQFNVYDIEDILHELCTIDELLSYDRNNSIYILKSIINKNNAI